MLSFSQFLDCHSNKQACCHSASFWTVFQPSRRAVIQPVSGLSFKQAGMLSLCQFLWQSFNQSDMLTFIQPVSGQSLNQRGMLSLSQFLWQSFSHSNMLTFSQFLGSYSINQACSHLDSFSDSHSIRHSLCLLLLSRTNNQVVSQSSNHSLIQAIRHTIKSVWYYWAMRLRSQSLQ